MYDSKGSSGHTNYRESRMRGLILLSCIRVYKSPDASPCAKTLESEPNDTGLNSFREGKEKRALVSMGKC